LEARDAQGGSTLLKSVPRIKYTDSEFESGGGSTAVSSKTTLLKHGKYEKGRLTFSKEGSWGRGSHAQERKKTLVMKKITKIRGEERD